MKKLFLSIGWILLLATLGCGSSTGTGGGGGTGTGVNGVDPDISNTDTTRGASSADINVGLSASKSVGKAAEDVSLGFGTAVGDKSIAGCEARQLWDEGARMSKEISVFLCYLTTCEANIKECKISDPTFNYLSFKFDSDGPNYAMEVRGKKVNDTRTIHVCEANKQSESFVFTNDTSARKVTFAMKHHFTSAQAGGEDKDFCDTNKDGTISDAERATCRSAGSFDDWFEMNGNAVYDATASGIVDSISEMDSLDVTGVMEGGFGKGSMGVVYDEDGSPSGGSVNKVKGGFANSFGVGDSGTGFMYAEFNSAEGSAKYSHTGAMPFVPQEFLPAHLAGNNYCPNFDNCDPVTQFQDVACKTASAAASCFCLTAGSGSGCTINNSGTEHFTISLGSDGKPTFKIASTSIFASNVSGTTLPTAVDSITKSFGSEAWDCKAPDGFAQINLPDEGIFATCIAKEKEAFEQSDRDTCFQDTGEDFAKEGVSELNKL